jgi:hypothetical protein
VQHHVANDKNPGAWGKALDAVPVVQRYSLNRHLFDFFNGAGIRQQDPDRPTFQHCSSVTTDA